MIEDKIQSWLIDEIVEVARESTSDGFNEHNATREAETLVENLVKKLTIPVVVSSFITAEDEGKYFIVNTDQLDEIEKGSVVYLLNTYPEDIHLFQDKNGDDVWLNADDVDRKE